MDKIDKLAAEALSIEGTKEYFPGLDPSTFDATDVLARALRKLPGDWSHSDESGWICDIATEELVSMALDDGAMRTYFFACDRHGPMSLRVRAANIGDALQNYGSIVDPWDDVPTDAQDDLMVDDDPETMKEFRDAIQKHGFRSMVFDDTPEIEVWSFRLGS